jgi:fermentation-respiration switch protein FrsA (DUF1100 family)
MSATPAHDYTLLDRPEVCRALFHPRGEWDPSSGNDNVHMIPVDGNVAIGARFHLAGASAANMLFFHGNGEILADYDDVGPLYNRLGINFLVADYRGYGRSGGTPTISAMQADSHRILEYTRTWLAANGYSGPLVVMGRSLGSAPALELAARGDHVDGLIIESGFALTAPLLGLLGVDVARLGLDEAHGFRNTDKIAQYAGPTLIIHAQYDHIIPYYDGENLFAASGAANKQLVRIDGANHNDLFYVGMERYLQAVAALVGELDGLVK